MALGFGKKNSEPEAKQSETEVAASAHSLYDSDTLSLDQFAAELEAVNPAAPTPGVPAANSPLSWDENSLLGDLNNVSPVPAAPNPDSVPTLDFSSSLPAPAQAPKAPTTVGGMFDDLEMELEGLPSFSTDFPDAAPAPAVPIPERKTRKKPTSPDLLSADNMMNKNAPASKAAVPKFSAPKLGKSKDAGPKVSSGGGKKKVGVLLGALGLLVVAGGAGGFLYFHNSQAQLDSLPLPAAPPRPVAQPTAMAPAPPSAVTPGAPAPGAVKPASTPAAMAPGAAPVSPPAPVQPAAPATGAAAQPAAPAPMAGTEVPVGVVPAGGKPTPDQQKILNRDWQGGADAKHFAEKAEKTGDAAGAKRSYGTAREYWEAGLKIQPDNAGFKSALAKLPPA